MITCDLDVLPKFHIISISNPIEMLIYTYTDNLSFSYPTKKSSNLLYNAVLLYGGTSLCHMVFTKHIEVGKISCLQWHVSSFELNMQLRDILHHFKPTAEAAASTSVFVHLILGQNTYKCFTTLGALPKHFFGFDVLCRPGQPQLSNLTRFCKFNVLTKPFVFSKTFQKCSEKISSPPGVCTATCELYQWGSYWVPTGFDSFFDGACRPGDGS